MTLSRVRMSQHSERWNSILSRRLHGNRDVQQLNIDFDKRLRLVECDIGACMTVQGRVDGKKKKKGAL